MSSHSLVLKQVTLLSVNGAEDPHVSLAALQVSARHIQFHSIKLLVAKTLSCRVPPNIELVRIPRMNWDDYNEFSVKDLLGHVSTEFVLTVQTDGFVLNHRRWRKCFLDFDYVGAPWPEAMREGTLNNRVGNSGFCLRSRRFLDHTSRLNRPAGMADDILFCRREFSRLAMHGIRYAPPPVAALFAVENSVPENPTASLRDVFGFHGRRTRKTRRLCDWLRNRSIPVESQSNASKE